MYRVTNPRYRPRSASSQAYHVWPARLIGLVVFVGGCQVLLHSLLARFPTEIRLAGSILPFGTLQWHRPATLLLGFLLVYLSAHLYRRRRAAWYVATAAMTLLLALHVHHWRLALAPALLLGLLVMFRSDFTVRSEPKSIVRGLLLAAGILALARVHRVGDRLRRGLAAPVAPLVSSVTVSPLMTPTSAPSARAGRSSMP